MRSGDLGGNFIDNLSSMSAVTGSVRPRFLARQRAHTRNSQRTSKKRNKSHGTRSGDLGGYFIKGQYACLPRPIHWFFRCLCTRARTVLRKWEGAPSCWKKFSHFPCHKNIHILYSLKVIPKYTFLKWFTCFVRPCIMFVLILTQRIRVFKYTVQKYEVYTPQNVCCMCIIKTMPLMLLQI